MGRKEKVCWEAVGRTVREKVRSPSSSSSCLERFVGSSVACTLALAMRLWYGRTPFNRYSPWFEDIAIRLSSHHRIRIFLRTGRACYDTPKFCAIKF